MKKESELTPLSIGLGIVIGIVMTMANVYLGLYAGMTVSASIPAAVISLGVFGMLKKKALLQSNIVQTMASAGESLAAGIIFTLPALVIVGAWNDFKFWPTTLIAISGGLLGVLFMIPLRKALIEDEEELIYPEGVACATVLKAGTSESAGGFFTIVKGLAWGGIFKLLSSGFKLFIGSVEIAKKVGGSVVFFGGDVSPALLAVGYIVNIDVAILVFLGGALGWIITIPMLGTPDIYSDLSNLDLAWTLWSKQVRYLGVGSMIVGGLWSIFSVRKGVMAGMSGLMEKYTKGASENESVDSQKDLSVKTMGIVFLVCFAIMLFLYNGLVHSFGMSLFTTIIMIVASFIFVAVSSYVVGLVGSSNNPVSGMTISALLASAILFLIFGYEGESAILATLGVAAVVCCAACTAGDCSQDLKTGSLLQATPRSQQIAQMIGIVIPAVVIAPTLTLLHEGYGIGTGLKAPQATLFASITKALFGNGELPYNMVIAGGIFGIFILLFDNLVLKKRGGFRLHLMPLAVGIYLPITLAVPMLVGGLIRYNLEKKRKEKNLNESEDKGILISSGFIAGEALMGVVIALFLSLNWNIGYAESLDLGLREILSVFAFVGISIYLYKVAKKS
ncbi:MAG: oligopeptide transporter, OPT family [Halobacteriovoraceae bacterium]|nr:oligopeptide transporter, OPT family [Halobacteriovoraceae bacterium]